MTNTGLLKYAGLEKTAFLPILVGVGKAIGWGLTAYGAYRAAKHNIPDVVDHVGKGEFFSDDQGGYGAAGDATEAAFNVAPGVSWAKRTRDVAKGTANTVGKWGGPSGQSLLWGPGMVAATEGLDAIPEPPRTDYSQDSTTTTPEPFNPHYQPQPQASTSQPMQFDNINHIGGNKMNFQFDGNQSTNAREERIRQNFTN
tara:strand:- start:8056 stop:8652 length:597 start_codon:yes stop_codon:yes gene_type:complete